MKLSDLLPLLPWEGLPLPRFLFKANPASAHNPNCNLLWSTWAHISRYANEAILELATGKGIISKKTHQFWSKQGLSLDDIKQCINEEKAKIATSLPSTVTLYRVFPHKDTCDILRRAKERDQTIRVKGGAVAFTDSLNIARTLSAGIDNGVIVKLDIPRENIVTCYITNPITSLMSRRTYLVVMPYIEVKPDEIIES